MMAPDDPLHDEIAPNVERGDVCRLFRPTVVQHPQGGYTIAVPESVGTAAIYHGHFETKRQARLHLPRFNKPVPSEQYDMALPRT